MESEKGKNKKKIKKGKTGFEKSALKRLAGSLAGIGEYTKKESAP